MYTRLAEIKEKINLDTENYKSRKKPEKNPLGVTDNWLPDMVRRMSISRAETDAIMYLQKLPGVYCCICGGKIYTKLTAVEYLQAQNIDLIHCGRC